MALSIYINKIKEDSESAYYEYAPTGKRFGKLRIIKSNGDVEVLEMAESDISGVQARAASVSLVRYWQKEEYPEKTYRTS